MTYEVEAALGRLLDRYVERIRRANGTLPMQAYDPAWVSPCQVGEPDANGMIQWMPKKRPSSADFGGLERALDVSIHPDIKSFYGRYWGDAMELQAEEGGLTLIQIWNDDDFDRLVKNILGHAMAKQRINAPLTVFIATTDEGEHMLSVDNDSGRVILEEPGSIPTKEISPSLAQFLDRINPVAPGGEAGNG
jgi:SecY interacting protein Syd